MVKINFDGNVFGVKGAQTELEDEGYPDIPRSLEDLVPHIIKVQSLLLKNNIPSYLAGGTGADILGSVLLPNHIPREHKDVDLLIPRWALRYLAESAMFEKIGFSRFKEWSQKQKDDNLNHPNLLVLTDTDSFRVDLMGFGEMGDTGYIPKMTWGGEIDVTSEPIFFTINPKTINLYGQDIITLASAELLKLQTQLDQFKVGNKHRDISLLQQLAKL